MPENESIELNATVGRVSAVDIEFEMRNAYLDYAMSVIVSRALPDVRDGLKPVQRRILYAMHDMGLRHNSAYRKSARIVGEVLGKYHPHGDSAVYEAMARMAQDFSLRYPLVDGQGNFGSIDGDSPAAMRYTEARLADIAEELLRDIDQETVDWQPNFDGSLAEPTVLPSRLPNLLLNGASGIAVGMATNIPPHNLGELGAAIRYIIDHYDERKDVSLETLMQFVKGPDFPTGGELLGRDNIRQAYATGRGLLTVRAKAEIEITKQGRQRIIVHEIPYQVNKSSLIERIANLVRKGRIDTISDLRDESDRDGLRIVVEVKKGASARKVLNQLYKFTPLQTSFGVNMLALVNGEPRLLSLKKALLLFLEHRQAVITRRTLFQLKKAKARAHILEGLRIALQFLDEVIRTIRESTSAETARTALMERFGLSDLQAQAILDMQLRRLAALERQKIEDEYQDVLAKILYLEDLLASPHKILAIIGQEMDELSAKYADERRTTIRVEGPSDFRDEDLVHQEAVIVTLTQQNYIKRTSAKQYRTQGRGGRGVRGIDTRENDVVLHSIYAQTLDYVLFFSNKGRVYQERVFNLPEGGRTARGLPLVNFLNLQVDEQITAMLPLSKFYADHYLVLGTRLGRLKRMNLSHFANVRPSGLIAITLLPGDDLVWALETDGHQDIILVTQQGKVLRFPEKKVRPMGRAGRGVRGIALYPGDELAAVTCTGHGDALFVITANGWGKRVPLAQIAAKGRATHGVWLVDHRRLDETGPVVTAQVVTENGEAALMTREGIQMRLRLRSVSMQSRTARGVRCITLREGDAVAALSLLPLPEPEPAK